MRYSVLCAFVISASVQAMHVPTPNANNIREEPALVYKNSIVIDNQEENRLLIEYFEKTMAKIEENKTPPDKTIINIFNGVLLFSSCVLFIEALYISEILYIYYKNRY